MSELTLPDKKSDEAYIVGGCKHPYKVVECLLNTGEIVIGIGCELKITVDWFKNLDCKYIGVGVFHQ